MQDNEKLDVAVVDYENQVQVKEERTGGMVEVDNMETIIRQAEIAERAINALNKTMMLALKITSVHDWVLIGGKPYLQESGSTKVATLFGISQDIVSVTTQTDLEGYKTFYVIVKLTDKTRSITAEGSRSMRDDFFSKGKDGMKLPSEIDEGDVRRSAITNAVNTAIKRMVPGLRGITAQTLEEAGFDLSKISGYTFKAGSKGGTPKGKEVEELKCTECGKSVSQTVASYSQSKFNGVILCVDCQKKKSTKSEPPKNVNMYPDEFGNF